MSNDKKVLLRISNLKQWFPLKKRGMYVKANDGIDLEIYEGESDSLQVVGPFFTVHVESPAAEGQGALSAAKKLYLGYADTITVNIPQMMHENNTRGE